MLISCKRLLERFCIWTLWGVVLLLSFVYPAKSQNLDLDILKSINPQNPGSDFWIQTSESAYWMPAAIAAGTFTLGLIKKDKNGKIKTYEILISVGSSILVSEILKPVIGRARPADAYPNEVFVNTPTHRAAFPSGHTTLAFSTATTLALQYKKWYVVVPAYLWAGAVGYSRMYLGKHYPSDVLAGAAVGAGGAILSHWLSKKLFKR